jgi:hypothetical protein
MGNIKFGGTFDIDEMSRLERREGVGEMRDLSV